MLRFLKFLMILLVLGGIGLVGFAYLGDISPDQEDRTIPVELNAG